MHESKRTTAIIAEIKKRFPRWYVFKHVQTGMSKIGVPDILACINGRFVGIEVKKVPNWYSEQQLYNLNKITKAGGLALGLHIKESKVEQVKFALDDVIDRSGSAVNLSFTTLPPVLRKIDFLTNKDY